MMRNAGARGGLALLVVGLAAASAFGQIILVNDPLQGSTTGTQVGGSFVAGGWMVGTDTTVDFNDAIYWHVATLPRGAAEYTVVGLRPDGAAWPTDKIEIFSMYDYTFEDADNNYGGWRNNPFKHFVRQEGVSEGAKNNMMEVEWLTPAGAQEPDSDALSWDPAVPYTFHEEWGSDGAGGTTLVITRNGTEIIRTTTGGDWMPAGHSVRIGSPAQGPRPSPFGAVYSNVKVWDMTGVPMPAEPAPPTPPPGTIDTGLAGVTGVTGITGGFGVNPLLGNLSSTGTGGATAQPPPVPPQYTTGGNGLSAYSTGGTGTSATSGTGTGGGSGGGGGGCFAGSPGGTGALALVSGLLALLAFVVRVR